MNKLYRWYGDWGRMGSLESVFVSTDEDIRRLKSCGEVYFGEVLGKHSEITCNFLNEDFEVLSDDPKVVEVIERFTPIGIDIFGYAEENLDRLDSEEESETDSEE